MDDVENIVEQGEQVIIFTQYTHTLTEIKYGLQKRDIRTVSLSGADNETQRTDAIDKFQSGQASVFIGNIKAAGTGINLYRSSIVIFADMEWTPALHEQAESRAHRYGQKKQVNVYYYVAEDTIDEYIMEVLETKKELIKEILEGNKDKIAKEESTQAKVLAALIHRK